MPLSNKYNPIEIYRRSAGDTFSPLTWELISNENDRGYIQPTGGNESFQFGKGSDSVQFRMFAPVDNTAILYGDKITQDGQSFIVLWQFQPGGIAGEGHHKEILMGSFQ